MGEKKVSYQNFQLRIQRFSCQKSGESGQNWHDKCCQKFLINIRKYPPPKKTPQFILFYFFYYIFFLLRIFFCYDLCHFHCDFFGLKFTAFMLSFLFIYNYNLIFLHFSLFYFTKFRKKNNMIIHNKQIHLFFAYFSLFFPIFIKILYFTFVITDVMYKNATFFIKIIYKINNLTSLCMFIF